MAFAGLRIIPSQAPNSLPIIVPHHGTTRWCSFVRQFVAVMIVSRANPIFIIIITWITPLMICRNVVAPEIGPPGTVHNLNLYLRVMR
jgi:hypothetical protein